jgi:hypothetical protein
VHLPVQLWASAFGGDGVTPDDAATVDRNLTAKPELRTVANAGHFAFLPPCSPDQARAHAQICADAEGFDEQSSMLNSIGKWSPSSVRTSFCNPETSLQTRHRVDL